MPSSFSTTARISARPASRPSARPCSNASLCASACRSASPLTVGRGTFCRAAADTLATSGAVQRAAGAGSFLGVGLDKLGAALSAQADGPFLGEPLRDHDDVLL